MLLSHLGSNFPPCYSDAQELEDFTPFLIIHLSTKAIAVPSALHHISSHVEPVETQSTTHVQKLNISRVQKRSPVLPELVTSCILMSDLCEYP